jgi:hypothetical protein
MPHRLAHTLIFALASLRSRARPSGGGVRAG